MAPRFANIKFNLLRAIEIFQDLNHEDMDVTAPPSATNFFKEHDLAEKLHKYLQHLINDGFFDDCDLREPEESVADEEEDEYEDENEEPDEEDASSSSGEEGDHSSTPRSEGFDASVEREHDRRGSRDSLTDRFKRYVRRIMPGNSKRSSSGRHHRRHNSRSNSESDSDDTHGHTITSSREHRSISKE